MTIGPAHYAALGGIVFAIGLLGVLIRRSGIALLLAIGVMFLGPVVALVGFSEVGRSTRMPPEGSALALIAVVAGMAQVAAGTALLTLVWRRRESTDLDDLTDLSA